MLEMQSQTTLFRPRDLRLRPTFCPSPPWIAPLSPFRTVIKPGYGPEDLTNTLASTRKKLMNKNVFI